jgi:1,2-dihydroxy-3-keto-5-methylthiopentene dioxygenase
VLSWRIDAANWEQEGKLAKIRAERGYKNHDFVLSKNIPNLEQKLDTFKTEHLHYDEEIRFMIEGGGYFDCKGKRARRAGDVLLTLLR